MAFPIEDESLLKRMAKIGLRDEDIDESFIRGTGAGGQKINKTSSTVVLVHVPTGTEVRCQRERSQSVNRLVAREELCTKLEQKLQAVRQEKRDAIEKKKRQNRKRPRGVKERILQTKHKRSDVKKQRAKVGGRRGEE
jgi:protein subunit release factor B